MYASEDVHALSEYDNVTSSWNMVVFLIYSLKYSLTYSLKYSLRYSPKYSLRYSPEVFPHMSYCTGKEVHEVILII